MAKSTQRAKNVSLAITSIKILEFIIILDLLSYGCDRADDDIQVWNLNLGSLVIGLRLN
jgi:hypothetical protein